MKKEYHLTNAKRGPVLKAPPGSTQVTFRLDAAVLDWFRQRAEEAGGGDSGERSTVFYVSTWITSANGYLRIEPINDQD
jgi:hypothetical protein